MTKLNHKNNLVTKETEASSAVNALVIPHPHLFTNGKFKVLIEGIEKDIQLIETVLGHYKGELITDITNGTPIKNCKLIARPISDMTDEELSNCPTFKKNDISPYCELKYRLEVWFYFLSERCTCRCTKLFIINRYLSIRSPRF